jgi:hypothetical protein
MPTSDCQSHLVCGPVLLIQEDGPANRCCTFVYRLFRATMQHAQTSPRSASWGLPGPGGLNAPPPPASSHAQALTRHSRQFMAQAGVHGGVHRQVYTEVYTGRCTYTEVYTGRCTYTEVYIGRCTYTEVYMEVYTGRCTYTEAQSESLGIAATSEALRSCLPQLPARRLPMCSSQTTMTTLLPLCAKRCQARCTHCCVHVPATHNVMYAWRPCPITSNLWM